MRGIENSSIDSRLINGAAAMVYICMPLITLILFAGLFV
jgi:hypothetical protein